MKELVINNIEELNKFISENDVTVSYFSTPSCNVCKVLKPKLIDLLESDFPKACFAYVNVEAAREVAAQNQIFSVPTILFHFAGKEFIRKSRNINLGILAKELERPYSLIID